MTALREQINLPINISNYDNCSSHAFLRSECNKLAVKFIDSWPEILGNINMVIIHGPHLSGKSTLLNNWKDRMNAINISVNYNLDEINNNTNFTLDDLELWQNNEMKLLHLINTVIHNNSYLLITSNFINFEQIFRKDDLISRLKAAPFVEIEYPDDLLIRQLLVNEFSKRQVRIDTDVIEFLTSNYTLNYLNILSVVEALDKLSLIYKKKITVNMIKKAKIQL